MCKISHKLKLCTCSTKNDKLPKNYWILYKYVDQGLAIVGCPIFPASIPKEIEKHNISFLKKQLNDGNCFDFEVRIEEKDRLQFIFSPIKSELDDMAVWNGNYIEYTFAFEKGKWKKLKYEPFIQNGVEKLVGKIKNAMERNSSHIDV
jgi:hypothetical protein